MHAASRPLRGTVHHGDAAVAGRRGREILVPMLRAAAAQPRLCSTIWRRHPLHLTEGETFTVGLLDLARIRWALDAHDN